MPIVDGLAYMNPGTGALILQVIMVVIGGGYVLVKNAGHKIKAIFTRRKSS